jgi:hypothetical protein
VLHTEGPANCLIAISGFRHPHNATTVAPSTLAPDSVGTHLLAKHRNDACKTGQGDIGPRLLKRAHPAERRADFPRHLILPQSSGDHRGGILRRYHRDEKYRYGSNNAASFFVVAMTVGKPRAACLRCKWAGLPRALIERLAHGG